MCLVRDAQCNENVLSFFAIYYFFNCLRGILDHTAETVSVNCQSSNFCQGNIENIPYVPSPLPSRSSSLSFPIYLSLQDDISQALLLFKWPKYFTFLRNRTQAAVINMFNFLIFINLTFRMLLNIHFQKYCYRFENCTFQRYLVLDFPTNPERVTLTKKVIFWGKKPMPISLFTYYSLKIKFIPFLKS